MKNKKHKRQTFKEIISRCPKPVPLRDETELPYEFDLNWDCKTFQDLKFWKLINDPTVKRLLREYGFDVNW